MDTYEKLISLVQLAMEDQKVFDQLSYILSLETFHRKSAINSLIDTMNMNNAPEEIVSVMSCLLDDQIAEQTKKILGIN